MKKKLVGFIYLLLLTGFCLAQIQHVDLVNYKNKYPNRSRISIKNITTVVIDFNKKDSIDIVTTHQSENIYIDKHANHFSEGSVRDSYFQRLEKIEAMSLIPSSTTKYKTYKVSDYEDEQIIDNSIFFDDISQRTYHYPNLREGAKTKLTYVTRSNFPQLISPFYFGDFTNSEYQEYTVKHHKDIVLDFRLFNGCDTLSTYSKSTEKNYIVNTWVVRDQEPFKDEYNAPSFGSSAPHVYPIIQSYTIDGKQTDLLNGLDGLHDWYTMLLKRTDLTVSPELKSTIDSIQSNSTNTLETVASIFNWVQHNVKYVAYEDGLGGFIPRPPTTVFDRKFGDCKDMAVLQQTMLAEAGIKAHVAWIGTRHKNYTYEQLPSPGCDNHMIAAYKSPEEKWYFLDATGTYTPFGHPSEFIQGKEALVHIDDDNYEIIEVEKVDARRNLSQDNVTITIDDLDIHGTGVATFEGYPLTGLKYALLDADSIKRFDIMRTVLEKGNNRFFLTLGEQKLDKHSKKGEFSYDFEAKDYLKSYKNELYVNLNLTDKLSSSKFETDRKLPYELDHYSNYDYHFNLQLKDEYTVMGLPESNKYVADDWGYEITYLHSKEDNSIDYRLKISIETLLIEPDKFDDWNMFIKQLNKNYRQVITLSKN